MGRQRQRMDWFSADGDDVGFQKQEWGLEQDKL